MSPATRDSEFERWLEEEFRRTVASVRGPSPRAEQAAYRAGVRPRGRPATARRAPLRRGAVALLAITLTVAGVSAVAMGAGSQVPAGLARSVAQIVLGCRAAGNAGGEAASAAGGCAASAPDRDPSGSRQQPAGGGDETGSQTGRAATPAARSDHGQQGGGSTGASGQGHDGGSGQGGRPGTGSTDHGRRASGGTGAQG